MTSALMSVRQEVNNFESSKVVQELEFAMNLALYVFYEAWVTSTKGSLSLRSLTSTAKLVFKQYCTSRRFFFVFCLG